MVGGGQEKVMQQFVECWDAKSSWENWMAAGIRGHFLGVAAVVIGAVECVVEIQLCSGGSRGVCSGADGGGEAGVVGEGFGESFQSLEFQFEQLQLICVLLAEERCLLPADEAG